MKNVASTQHGLMGTETIRLVITFYAEHTFYIITAPRSYLKKSLNGSIINTGFLQHYHNARIEYAVKVMSLKRLKRFSIFIPVALGSFVTMYRIWDAGCKYFAGETGLVAMVRAVVNTVESSPRGDGTA